MLAASWNERSFSGGINKSLAVICIYYYGSWPSFLNLKYLDPRD
jgi:hypothetical protein